MKVLKKKLHTKIWIFFHCRLNNITKARATSTKLEISKVSLMVQNNLLQHINVTQRLFICEKQVIHSQFITLYQNDFCLIDLIFWFTVFSFFNGSMFVILCSMIILSRIEISNGIYYNNVDRLERWVGLKRSLNKELAVKMCKEKRKLQQKYAITNIMYSF